jgi:anthranilate synthase component 1
MAACGTSPASASVVVDEYHYEMDFLRLQSLEPERYPFLLESAASGTEHGRYDILLAFPGDSLQVTSGGQCQGPHARPGLNFLQSLDCWFKEDGNPEATGELPFCGGWFLYLAFEFAREIEPSLQLGAEPDWPLALATRVPAALVRDHETQRGWLVAESSHAAVLETMKADLVRTFGSRGPRGPAVENLTEEPEAAFLRSVARAKEYIYEGDVFQANLSRAWHGKLVEGHTPIDVYARLRHTNPGPFAGLAYIDGRWILSSSPERLVRVSPTGRIDTRPIAGTRPRDEPDAAMQERRAELLAHPKERAEHIMLIDLERNDLGRVCKGGSVRVDEYMTVESYRHVHHIVSNVTGELRPDASPGDVIAAVFPGGTITGCPKVRCIEIIRELEQRPRGVYTGSMGYLNRDGSLDLNILIRTIACNGSRIRLDAGSGIVADSSARRELEETRAKARGVLAALETG